jgi:hypothetical protein
VIEETTNQEIEIALVTEEVVSEVAWTTRFASLTKDVTSQTNWIAGCAPVIEDASSQTDLTIGLLPVTKFTDPFSTVTGKVATTWTIGV